MSDCGVRKQSKRSRASSSRFLSAIREQAYLRNSCPRFLSRFFTTKSPDKGTGLGLSQTYGFAQQSGGAVVVSSTVGQGKRVILYLPRSRAPVTLVASNQSAGQPQGQGE